MIYRGNMKTQLIFWQVQCYHTKVRVKQRRIVPTFSDRSDSTSQQSRAISRYSSHAHRYIIEALCSAKEQLGIYNTVCSIFKKKRSNKKLFLATLSQLYTQQDRVPLKRSTLMLQSKGSTSGELHTSHSSFFLATTKVTINSQTNNFLNTDFKTKTTTHFKTQIYTSKFQFPTFHTTFTYYSLHIS